MHPTSRVAPSAASGPGPVAVFPVHDPDGIIVGHLEKIAPDLRETFERVILSVTAPTLSLSRGRIERLADDGRLVVVENPAEGRVGDHFVRGFRTAVAMCRLEQPLHLCTVDRLAYALETGHRQAFLSDVAWASAQERPVLFQRSPQAWRTHPRSYQAIEAMITRAGEVLLGKTLDYAWCHLVVRAATLAPVLPRLEGVHDLTFFARIVLLLHDRITTRDVDWLAWEDPFILGRDPEACRMEREADPADHAKRLGYAILMVQAILAYTCGGSSMPPQASTGRPRPCDQADLEAIYGIVNEAAQAYRGIIPDDRWHEPYMSREELLQEVAAGVAFWGWEEDGHLVAVMGLQHKGDVCLIRHAYVVPARQNQGLGGGLLIHVRQQTAQPLLVGTWAAAHWAIRFYERHGFRQVTPAEKDHLLRRYWSIPERQIETSVVLADATWFSARRE